MVKRSVAIVVVDVAVMVLIVVAGGHHHYRHIVVVSLRRFGAHPMLNTVQAVHETAASGGNGGRVIVVCVAVAATADRFTPAGAAKKIVRIVWVVIAWKILFALVVDRSFLRGDICT